MLAAIIAAESRETSVPRLTTHMAARPTASTAFRAASLTLISELATAPKQLHASPPMRELKSQTLTANTASTKDEAATPSLGLITHRTTTPTSVIGTPRRATAWVERVPGNWATSCRHC